jgi:hypothetical protein
MRRPSGSASPSRRSDAGRARGCSRVTTAAGRWSSTRGDVEFERIADVRLKEFSDSTEIFIAREPEAG